MDIYFIGVGVMGRGMVRNLMKAGHRVHIYSRTKERAQPVIDEGALWYSSVAECAKKSSVIITIVGYPKDVEEVYFGAGGILENAPDHAIVADMTTSSPGLAEKIYEAAKAKGLRALDAPVSGGDSGAKNGTLAIMVGGDKAAFDECLPVFEAMGKSIRYMGKAGSGQHTKMANQIVIAGTISGVCEAIAYANKAGVDAQGMLDAISSGAAASWQLSNNGQKIINGDFAPGFYIKHFIKDMGLAKDEADSRALPLPVLEKTLDTYRALAQKGLGDEGTQALIKAYED
mgnify:CR=1 FL=1